MIRNDRRELAGLSAALLAWGLLFAPVLHVAFHDAPHAHGPSAGQRAHDESQPHDHEAPPQSEHGAGSLEHSQFVTHAGPQVPSLVAVFFAAQPLVLLAPRPVEQSERVSPEQPQGP